MKDATKANRRAWLRRAAPIWLFMFLAAVRISAQDSPEQTLPHETKAAASGEKKDAQPPLLRALPRSILRDQQQLWLQPFRVKRSEVPWILAFAGATAGLIRIDRPFGQELTEDPPGTGHAVSRRVGQFSDATANFSVAGAFYLVGRWRSEERARTTGLLGLRALANSTIIVHSLKAVTRRPRPGNEAGDANHNSDGEFFTGGGSFPSGHAAGAWALATVVARQYEHRRWVPLTAYGLAGLVAGSRITARKHFPSDVVVGSALGFVVGRHVLDDANRRRWDLIPHTTPGAEAISLVVKF
jgi:membrane-associated phospholipid phosphatase